MHACRTAILIKGLSTCKHHIGFDHIKCKQLA